METTFEEDESGELAPFDHVQVFLLQNSSLIDAMISARNLPSVDAFGRVHEQAAAAKNSLVPFFESKFFKDGDPADKLVAIDSVMVASLELVEAGRQINPLFTKKIEFGDTFKDSATLALEDDESAGFAAERLCNIYGESVDGVVGEAFLTAPAIQDFAERKIKASQRKEYLRIFAIVTAGSYLAYVLAQRRKK